MDWTEWIEHAALTDVGRHRTGNQDAFVTALAVDAAMFRERGHLFLVADGMGAHAAGELASKMAVDNIPLIYNKYGKIEPAEALRMAILTANEAIHRRGQMNMDFAGMGTTVAALIVLGRTAVVAHVGDSRAYRVRGDCLSQLTRDHSLAWELVARGRLKASQVEQFGATNVITRSVGPDPTVEVDLQGPFPIEPGDCFVLCSDGLTTPVSDVEIGLLARYAPPETACRALIHLANARGGPDNITVQMVRVLKTGAVEPTADATAANGPKKPPDTIRALAWLATHRVTTALAALALSAAYLTAAFYWTLPGIALAGALGVVALLGLGVEWYSRRLRRSTVAQPPVTLNVHRDTPLALSAEQLHPLADTCREEVLQIRRAGNYDEASRLGDLLAQAKTDTDAGRFQEALGQYIAILVAAGKQGKPA